MGTRADFYIGRSSQAEWLGSVAWDGYPEGFDAALFAEQDEATFRATIADLLAGRDDGTTPDLGWPWPWDTSATTDFAYALDEGAVWGSCFGRPWFRVDPEAKDCGQPESDEGDRPEFPDMSGVKATTYGRRSGVMIISMGGES